MPEVLRNAPRAATFTSIGQEFSIYSLRGLRLSSLWPICQMATQQQVPLNISRRSKFEKCAALFFGMSVHMHFIQNYPSLVVLYLQYEFAGCPASPRGLLKGAFSGSQQLQRIKRKSFTQLSLSVPLDCFEVVVFEQLRALLESCWCSLSTAQGLQ